MLLNTIKLKEGWANYVYKYGDKRVITTGPSYFYASDLDWDYSSSHWIFGKPKIA